MDSTKILLGRKIRLLRKAKGWTQDYLSEQLEINPKSILRIEQGQTFPTIQNLEKLADVFGIEIVDLFNNRSLDDISKLKKDINEIVENLDDDKIRYLYSFLNAIKWLWYNSL